MKLEEVTTEKRNRASEDLDMMSALEIVTVMNHEDSLVPRSIESVLPEIAKAVDVIAKRLAEGGRLIYVGSGTSGRIGALDALECPPTFGTDPEKVQFVIAGGEASLTRARESSEDSAQLGRSDMAAREPGSRDVVVALAASGSTPYTISALEYAKCAGATTVTIVCSYGAELAKAADIPIEVEVGPEVLTGSSRLKAGTAQKLICNMLSTGAMARMGYVYSNLMVNLDLTNKKLQERGIATLEYLAQVSPDIALEALEKADMRVPLALVMLKTNASKSESLQRLQRAKGNVRRAIGGTKC